MLNKVSVKNLFMFPGAVKTIPFHWERPIWENEKNQESPRAILNSAKPLKEYLLVIKPREDITNKVAAEKENFYLQYLQKKHSLLTPHITVAGFLAKESMEETLIRWIQRICSLHKSFIVTLNNYSGFPPDTIYLRVQDHEPFQQLARQLKIIDEYIQSNGCPEIRLMTRPHLSIAKQLPQKIYDKAMLDYSQKLFFESFTAGELLLLRIEKGTEAYKVINVFGLLPKENNLFN